MSRTLPKTLPFAENLLAIGRNLDRFGQSHAAVKLMKRVCALGRTPGTIAEEARVLLAELYLQRGEYKKARRKLSAALAFASDDAYYHFLMAGAIEDDEDGDPERALYHYRQCVTLEPENATYWAALGILSVEVGEPGEAAIALERAVELAPDNYDILDQIVHALWEAGDLDRARKFIQAALFRDARNQHCRDLWARHQFQELHGEQKAAKRQAQYGKGYPAILRFDAPNALPSPRAKGNIRHDLPSGLPGPKRPLPRRVSGKRKAHP